MPRPRRDGRRARPTSKARLTDRSIRAIPPDLGRRVVVWDAVQRGLCVVTHPSAAKVFKVVYRHGRRPRWLSLGDASIGIAGARRLAARVLFQVAEGRDPQGERRAERAAGTFADLADRYVAEWSRRRNKSWEQAASLVRKHLVPRWRNVPARAITRADVRGAIAAPILANQVLAAASAIFTWAVNVEAIAFNPARGVERNPTTSRARVLSDSELRTLWPRFDPALKLLVLTGQRPGEVANMRRRDIVDGWWHLSGAPAADWPGTKNGADHRVWLSEPALALIEPHIADRSRSRSEALLRRLCAENGIDPARPHDLRRTCLTTITRLGFSRDAMDRVANHRDGRVRDVYDRHCYENEDRVIMAAVARHVIAIVEGRAEGNVVRLR
jgi:integrase